MIPLDVARQAAERFLDEHVRDRFEFEIVIVDRAVRDNGEAWVFPYDGKVYVESNDWAEAMAGNVPIAVNKETGSADFAA
jgi:hypothetical protein